MDVCVVFVVGLIWNISNMKNEKDFIQYKNGSKGKTPGKNTKKKSHLGHGCLCCVCCKDGNMERKVT
jgi:hypothetical protein